jgi:membrane protein implicated in regulation of membrane protease activity
VRKSPRTARILAVLSETFWLLVIAVIAMFAFFTVLGAFSPGQVVGLTLVVAALAVLWVVHAVWQSRHSDGRDPNARRARERRGF